MPWSEGGLAEAPSPHADAVVVPVPVAPSGEPAARARHRRDHLRRPPREEGPRPRARGVGAARRDGEELVVAGLAATAHAGDAGVRFAGTLPRDEYRALLRRARVFVTAPRREDYGIAQLEALADGCALVTTPAPGPVRRAAARARARPAARHASDLAAALRAALDDPAPGYAERAAAALRPWRPPRSTAIVADGFCPACWGRHPSCRLHCCHPSTSSATGPAVSVGDDGLTYAELREAAAAVAREFDGAERVAVWAESTLETIVAAVARARGRRRARAGQPEARPLRARARADRLARRTRSLGAPDDDLPDRRPPR